MEKRVQRLDAKQNPMPGVGDAALGGYLLTLAADETLPIFTGIVGGGAPGARPFNSKCKTVYLKNGPREAFSLLVGSAHPAYDLGADADFFWEELEPGDYLPIDVAHDNFALDLRVRSFAAETPTLRLVMLP